MSDNDTPKDEKIEDEEEKLPVSEVPESGTLLKEVYEPPATEIQEQGEEVTEPIQPSPAPSVVSTPTPAAPPERVVIIEFRKAGKTYLYDAGNLELAKGDWIIIETERGLGLAEVIVAPRAYAGESTPEDGFRRVIRRANEKDLAYHEKNVAKEHEAFEFCKKRIEEERLKMKLVDVIFLHSGGKGIFSFSSEERVDFRNLVRDLAQKFHTRIEMRQIGVRDESKIIGGIGHCGRQLCCASWIRDFQPVSIKMAKDQNLSLNPVKVSGVCGRLLCCLGYEAECYKELIKDMPRVGKKIDTPQGPGEVINVDVFKRTVSVHLDEGGYGKFKQEEVCPCQRKPQG